MFWVASLQDAKKELDGCLATELRIPTGMRKRDWWWRALLPSFASPQGCEKEIGGGVLCYRALHPHRDAKKRLVVACFATELRIPIGMRKEV